MRGADLNATYDPYNRRPRALAHAGWLAETLRLDLAAAGWVPSVENYLGRVTKARILEAVREAKGEQAAQRLEGLKKGDMAEVAAQLLVGSGWLPEPLRTAGVATYVTHDDDTGQVVEAGEHGVEIAPRAETEMPVEPRVEDAGGCELATDSVEQVIDPAASDAAALVAE